MVREHWIDPGCARECVKEAALSIRAKSEKEKPLPPKRSGWNRRPEQCLKMLNSVVQDLVEMVALIEEDSPSYRLRPRWLLILMMLG